MSLPLDIADTSSATRTRFAVAQHSRALKAYRALSAKLCICVYIAITLGVSNLFASEFAFVHYRATSFDSLAVDLEASVEPNMLRSNLQDALRMSCRGQWQSNSKRMADIWKLALGGSLLLLPLSVAFLQIDRIDADLLPRTMTLLVFMFASGAFTSGSALVIVNGTCRLDGYRVRMRWKEACQFPNLFSSLDFWACMALPVSSVLWSLLFSLCVICFVAFMPRPEADVSGSVDSHHRNVAAIVGTAVVGIVIVVQLVQLYRLVRLVRGCI